MWWFYSCSWLFFRTGAILKQSSRLSSPNHQACGKSSGTHTLHSTQTIEVPRKTPRKHTHRGLMQPIGRPVAANRSMGTVGYCRSCACLTFVALGLSLGQGSPARCTSGIRSRSVHTSVNNQSLHFSKPHEASTTLAISNSSSSIHPGVF